MLALAAAASAAAPAPLPLLFSPSLEKEQRRWQCVALKKEGHSNAYIARRSGLNPTHCRCCIIKRYRATTGSPGSGSRSGRPRATTEDTTTLALLSPRASSHSPLLVRSVASWTSACLAYHCQQAPERGGTEGVRRATQTWSQRQDNPRSPLLRARLCGHGLDACAVQR